MNQYTLPDTRLLQVSSTTDKAEEMELAAKLADTITDRSDELGLRLEIDHEDGIVIGPQVISFNCIAAEKISVRKIPALSQDLQYDLGCKSIQIHAPQPGSKFIVIEVDREFRDIVRTGDVISRAKSPLEFPLGVTPQNDILSLDIRNAPHLLIAGETNAGKSVALCNMICSLLMKTTPDELLFHMTDSKQVELTAFDGIPNLLCPVVTDAFEAVDHFHALVITMENRYKLAKQYNAKTLDELNAQLPVEEKLPYILIVVDEIADLMFLSKKNIEESVVRIAAKARAVGYHLVLATQSPRREVISGLLKCNLPSRIAFATASELDSRIIIDKNGAGQLLGAGDSLYSPQGKAAQRVQSPLITTPEIEAICDHWKSQIYWKQYNTERMVAA